ncbi:hypothetical protein [Chryseobacterium sp.]|uniref:Acb2/Tad1 domain-containing protein n=1 Tax=Chryseobacterium sp. TaxID=1871047 RepID=UPI00321C05EE
MAKSLGEKRVRVDFNPMSSDKVMFMKKEFAQMIDELEQHKQKDSDPETLRLIATAQTKIEEAAMWTVKAITK